MVDDKRCSGIRTSGYWKGQQCSAAPTIFKEEKWWCKNHVPMNLIYNEKEDIVVGQEDLYTLLICTLRYCFGRQTYMPSYICEMIEKYSIFLNKDQIKKIYKEIEDEIQHYERMNETMGATFDHEMWKQFVNKYKEKQNEKTRS